LVAGRVFAQTAAFVGAGVEILPGPGGSVYVVEPHAITQLALN
jgi:hypothetical protein